VGTCFGPILSEVLFDMVGYTMTFGMFGCAQILISCIIFLRLPPVPTPTENLSLNVKDMVSAYWEIIKLPSVLVFVVTLGASEMGYTFMSTILEPGLEPVKDFLNNLQFLKN